MAPGSLTSYGSCLMSAYRDCLTCACLVRAQDSKCPFCGTRLRKTVASSLTLSLVLMVGLGVVTIACGHDDGDTVADTATATVTMTDSDATVSDSWDADAVTYAGPDENDSTGQDWPGTTTSDGTSSSGSSGSGSSDGSSTTGGASSSATETGCSPITDDASAIGTDCVVDDQCPDGYTCQPFEGFVLQMQCQILCEETCECPMGLTCNETADKSGATWSQCG